MNRKIMFRAWFPAGTDTGDGEIEKGQMCYDLAFEEYEPINDLLAGVEHLMQFTGLYDKNKNPIYEGDIVRFYRDAYKLPYEIKWGYASWRGENPNISPQGCSIPNFTDMENVGNVLENPELLKDK